jgi:hypothetical protein
MKDQNCIGRSASRIFLRSAEAVVVHPQFRQHLARFEMKIAQCDVAFLGRGHHMLLRLHG